MHAVYDTIPDSVDKDGHYLKLEERKTNTADVVYEDMQPKLCDVVYEDSSSIDNYLKLQGREEHTGNLYEDIQPNLNTYSNKWTCEALCRLVRQQKQLYNMQPTTEIRINNY